MARKAQHLLRSDKGDRMVGLLIVSHSAHIAAGLKELADQMTGGRVPIAAVGGTSDGRIGTSPDQIRASFDQIATVDGVLVMTDLGSAVMSAEYALEDVSYPYWLSNAPLVEGAVLAAVEASLGSTLQQIASAAERAWSLEKTPARMAVVDRTEQRSIVEATLTIAHPAGLHLRPAARFVKTAASYTCSVRM